MKGKKFCKKKRKDTGSGEWAHGSMRPLATVQLYL